ncbi:threonine/homoserine/homoserine lactone efflux protein|uniref:Threonine/homoserine/homoserine lactone efflux protein n=1 Tax=Brenneria salicis ATCC 15712 = DSM 30166 TaxID=714314 RepID=A0A366ID17_9GAMM|nr:LysE family translocator [Brenneria salicis]NMN92188.1 threonine/homoserine/homoserine lactone efflux protein [Brenneria salicis ATCC 15712 = DSM 30166]RBP67523.1 threonine/homoserine/homoserine lactone efflux protein [Brenneria salicis ATCC 15712 = DSM 30166]RLM32489.1 lysine transporter LysE [Brenneria salicis ATCC 15712 = DSM 30166]
MLGTAQIISYIAALGLAAAIPGPGMTALVARSVSGGAVTGFTMLAGLILGDLIYLSIAVFGLAVIAHNYTSVFTLINWAASLYLCILAWQFWCRQPHAMNIDQKATKRELASAWFSGLTITLGNPKTIAFYLAILPLVISLDNVSLQIWGGMLVPLTVFVLLTVGAVFILAALRIRHFLTSAKAQRLLFRSAGFIMMLAAFGMVVKTL